MRSSEPSVSPKAQHFAQFVVSFITLVMYTLQVIAMQIITFKAYLALSKECQISESIALRADIYCLIESDIVCHFTQKALIAPATPIETQVRGTYVNGTVQGFQYPLVPLLITSQEMMTYVSIGITNLQKTS